MARIARVIASGIPHHVTQRGNQRLTTFFGDDDYNTYIDLMAEWCQKCGVEIWAYCLMPNHVHLIAVPETEDGLRRGIGEVFRLSVNWIFKPFVINHHERRKVHSQDTSQLQPPGE